MARIDLEGDEALIDELDDTADRWGTAVEEEVVSNDTPYGPHVEWGTDPHTIEGNPLLSFEWRGRDHVFHSVQHPGTSPQPFFRPAVDVTGFQMAVIATQVDSLEEFMDQTAGFFYDEVRRLTPVDEGVLKAGWTRE